MIVRIIDPETKHMDREALAHWIRIYLDLESEVPEITVRRRCRDAIVGRDPATGRVLYDVQLAEAMLQAVKLRPERRGKLTRRRA